MLKDVCINGRVFRAGDLTDAVDRELGHKHPRLSMFTGESLPRWWDWELELSPHVEKRMEDRGFTEVDLRAMMEDATSHEPDVVDGRFLLKDAFVSAHGKSSSSPTIEARLTVVVTAYPVHR